MRTVTFIAILLFCSITFAAEEKDGPAPRDVTEETGQKTEESRPQEEITEEKSLQWPRPYQPREEISADSTVPFPTDI